VVEELVSLVEAEGQGVSEGLSEYRYSGGSEVVGGYLAVAAAVKAGGITRGVGFACVGSRHVPRRRILGGCRQ